jgi:pimeloyl-ACP methyl ester carboxylesterase
VARPLPEVEGVTHRDVNAGGVQLHVAEAGEGEPVVLVHGWPQHWFAWRHVIPALAEHYRVICPDLRGFGWSEAPGHGYNPDQFGADIVALLDTLELDQVRVAGHDWGGIAGFVVCLEHPERVSKFMPMGTGHPWIKLKPGDLPKFAYQLVLAAPVAGNLFVSKGLERFLKDPVWSEEVRRSYLDQFSEPERVDASVKLYRAALATQVSRFRGGGGDPPKLTTPTLFLQGSDDPVLKPEMLQGYEKHAAHMRLEVLDGVRHFIPEQAPDAVLERMLAFFSA